MVHENAYNEYLNKNWNKSIELFKKVVELKPEDKPSKIMIERCNEYKYKVLEEDWNGSIKFDIK